MKNVYEHCSLLRPLVKTTPGPRPLTTWAAPATLLDERGCMIKSELVLRIAEQNPHLYNRDVEKVVNAIFDQIAAALARRQSSGVARLRMIYRKNLVGSAWAQSKDRSQNQPPKRPVILLFG
jgi:hypothetical protein